MNYNEWVGNLGLVQIQVDPYDPNSIRVGFGSSEFDFGSGWVEFDSTNVTRDLNVHLIVNYNSDRIQIWKIQVEPNLVRVWKFRAKPNSDQVRDDLKLVGVGFGFEKFGWD